MYVRDILLFLVPKSIKQPLAYYVKGADMLKVYCKGET